MAERKSSVVLELVNRIGGPMRRIRRQVQNETRAIGRNFSTLSNRVRAVSRGVIAGATAGALALGAITRSYAESTREIDLWADRLGMSERSLSRWVAIGKRFGVQQDAMIDGFKELSLRSDEYIKTKSGGSANEALRRLGLSKADMRAVSNNTEAMVQLVMSRLRRVGDFAARQRIADEIFGGQGAEQMVAMISESAAELKRIGDEAERSGALITDSDAKNAEQYADAMARLREQFAGVRNIVGGQLLPVITDLAGELRSLIADNRPQINAWAKDFGEKLPGRIRETITAVRDTARAIKNVIDMIGGWKSAFIGVAALMSAPIVLPIAGILYAIGKIIAKLAKAKAAKKALNTMLSTDPFNGKVGASKWGSWLNKASAVAAAGAVGWAIGSEINKRIEKSRISETVSNVVGRSVDTALAAMGNDAAAKRLANTPQGQADAARERADAVTAKLARRQAEELRKYRAGQPSAYDHIPLPASARGASGGAQRTDVGGTLKIEIDSMGRPRVRDVRSNGPMDIDVDSGPLLLGG